MKRLILTLCLVLACGTAYSGEKEHRALAEELIKITDGDKVMDGMKAQVSMVFQQITSQMNVQEADKPKLEKYTKRFEDIRKLLAVLHRLVDAGNTVVEIGRAHV